MDVGGEVAVCEVFFLRFSARRSFGSLAEPVSIVYA